MNDTPKCLSIDAVSINSTHTQGGRGLCADTGQLQIRSWKCGRKAHVTGKLRWRNVNIDLDMERGEVLYWT